MVSSCSTRTMTIKKAVFMHGNTFKFLLSTTSRRNILRNWSFEGLNFSIACTFHIHFLSTSHAYASSKKTYCMTCWRIFAAYDIHMRLSFTGLSMDRSCLRITIVGTLQMPCFTLNQTPVFTTEITF